MQHTLHRSARKLLLSLACGLQDDGLVLPGFSVLRVQRRLNLLRLACACHVVLCQLESVFAPWLAQQHLLSIVPVGRCLYGLGG